jgi:ATP-binding protein involved in chromosome partitioning
MEKRFEQIKRIIGVASGKGGVGKSLTASTLALILSKRYKVGLLDLDFYGPSAHVIFGIKGAIGIKGAKIEEDKGIVPQEVHNIKFMSIVYFAGDNPLSLRGEDLSNGIVEMLAVTQWGSLDFLIIDLPPGMGDPTLDVIRLIKKMEFLIVTTPSKISLEVVKKELQLLKEAGAPIIGVIENMKTSGKIDFDCIGSIGFDEHIESAIGDVDKLSETKFARELKKIIDDLVEGEREEEGENQSIYDIG